MVPKLACSDPLLMDRSSTHLALAGILNRSDTDGSISFIKKKKKMDRYHRSFRFTVHLVLLQGDRHYIVCIYILYIDR